MFGAWAWQRRARNFSCRVHLPLRTPWRRHPVDFGEWLSRPLLACFGLEIEWSRPDRCELIATGEGLDQLPDHSRALILGAGFRFPEAVARLPQARPYAVRGRLTPQKIGAGPEVALGDLALLADALISRPPSHGRLGVVLAKNERDDPALAGWLEQHATALVVIPSDTTDAAGVLRQIAACQAVLTTSAVIAYFPCWPS